VIAISGLSDAAKDSAFPAVTAIPQPRYRLFHSNQTLVLDNKGARLASASRISVRPNPVRRYHKVDGDEGPGHLIRSLSIKVLIGKSQGTWARRPAAAENAPLNCRTSVVAGPAPHERRPVSSNLKPGPASRILRSITPSACFKDTHTLQVPASSQLCLAALVNNILQISRRLFNLWPRSCLLLGARMPKAL
jgi:hypothetical protein